MTKTAEPPTVKSQARIKADERANDSLQPAREAVAELRPRAQANAEQIIKLAEALTDAISEREALQNEALKIAASVWGPKQGRAANTNGLATDAWLGKVKLAVKPIVVGKGLALPVPTGLSREQATG